MSQDEDRIARLTEIARRVWPNLGIHVEDGCVLTRTRDNIYNEPLRIVHPRALDALEAALLVLADEDRIPLTADQVTRDALESCRRDREALTRRIREERAAMEQLASDFEANKGIYQSGEEACLDCARELREQARKA